MNDKKKDMTIYTADQLWAELSESAAFEDVDYDSALLDDIKSYLNIDKSKDLLEELKDVAVEELLNALFTSIEPFSEMLKDLLEVFSKAGAKYGDKNLKIEVDFGKLEIDLEKFKVDVETISEQIHKAVKTYFLNNPWELRKLFQFDENMYSTWDVKSIENEEIREWVTLYLNGVLPDYFPKQPKINDEVDCRVGVVWNYLKRIYKTVKSVYKEEKGIRESVWGAAKDLRQQSEGDLSNYSKEILSSKAQILQNETDYYTCTIMVAISKFIEHLHGLSKGECNLLLVEFKARYAEILDNNNSEIHYETFEKIKQIKSFLNLPYWKHRYEIYSAWVFTLIAKAFGYANLQFKLKNDDTLSFAFGGSHLATYNQGEPLEIWAECYSVAIAKIEEGKKGRKNGIQPDYTIAFADAKVPDNSIAVVECKQYKKSNTYNFSEAIIDYANNRPNAKIFLVNYGAVGNSVNQNVINKGIDEARFATFGNVRPQNSESFVAALKSYLFEPLKITLTWGECPFDLDLMLDVIDLNTGSVQHINYENKGNIDSSPYAVLNYDYMNGFGPEIIMVNRIEKDKEYSIKVHKFSREDEIDREVALTLECKAFHKVYIKNNIFDLWNVCTVKNGQIL